MKENVIKRCGGFERRTTIILVNTFRREERKALANGNTCVNGN